MVWTAPQEKPSCISEGDTPTFLNLQANGLRAYENGDWGGWGGRRRPGNASGFGRGGAPGGGRGGQAMSPKTAAVNARFFAASQNDFAARLKWSVTPEFSAANHAPKD